MAAAGRGRSRADSSAGHTAGAELRSPLEVLLLKPNAKASPAPLQKGGRSCKFQHQLLCGCNFPPVRSRGVCEKSASEVRWDPVRGISHKKQLLSCALKLHLEPQQQEAELER